MRSLKLIILLGFLFIQSCASPAKENRKIAFIPENCSKYLQANLDLENYQEEIYAQNVFDYHQYKNGKISIADQYLKDPRFTALSKDPDHNFKITMTSKLEAVTGLEAERLGLIAAPIARGPPKSEFIDGNKKLWDVKTPISPLKFHSWSFKPEIVGNSLVKKLKKNKNMHILLNKSFMSYRDKELLNLWMKRNISKDLRKRIAEVYFSNPFNK